MVRALVIGGTAFIGRALVEQLLRAGDHVTIMHRGKSTPFGDRVGEIHCDRNDIAAVRAALSGPKFDVVYDNVYDWQRGTTAEQVSAAAVATSAGLRRYVFMSSVAVYPHGGPYGESDDLVPADDPNLYAQQKAESERALFALHQQQGMPVTTLRPAFVYGPHNQFPREAFFWDRIMADRPVIVPEDGARTMQWVHVDDVARAAITATQKAVANGRAYNLAEYPPITHNQFVQLLARVAGKTVTLVHVPRQTIAQAGGQVAAPPLYFGAYLDIPSITVKSHQARFELGVDLRPLEQGMRETFEWYQQHSNPAPDFAWDEQLLATVR